MPIKIFKTTPMNFPDRVAVCGSITPNKGLLLGARRKRTEWVYNQLANNIVINTAIDHGEVIGQITALPLDNSPIELEGEGLWYIPCIWMIQRRASHAIAERLLLSAIGDLKGIASGLTTLSDERWMNHKSFLESFGFFSSGNLVRVGVEGNIMILPFDSDAPMPVKIPRCAPNIPRGELHFFYSSHCPVHALTAYRLTKENKRIADKTTLIRHDAADRTTIERFGYSFALLVDGARDILRDYLAGEPIIDLVKERK